MQSRNETTQRVRHSSLRGAFAFCILHLAFCILTLSACAVRRIELPTDPGAPLPDFSGVHAQVSSACAMVRTLTAEMGLSGRAGDQRLRGRLIAGFQQPAAMRLEAVAPFGPPVFILAARGEAATLLLVRDNRVVRDASAQEILGALTGVRLGASDIHAVLTGCVVPQPRPIAGRVHQNGWASIDLDGGASIYLVRGEAGEWRPAAARRAGWQIEYLAWEGPFPRTVRLRSEGAGVAVELTATLSQLETNADLDAAAFTVDVPAGARLMTMDELRASGPLRGEDVGN